MTDFSCEVAVIGGGLAGCGAALSLARSGVDVALFEAGTLPRHRVCGEFLSPESRATLDRLTVLPAILEAGARSVETARFCCDGQSAVVGLGAAAGLAISRHRLDPLLIGAAQSLGARIFLGAKTRALQRRGAGFHFEASGQNWSCKAVIVAAGRDRSPKTGADVAARFCGLKAHFSGVDLEVGAVEMHLFRGGYCGLVRVEGGVTNACLMVSYAHLQSQSPAAFWGQLLREIPALKARFARAERVCAWQSTGNVSFGTFRPTATLEIENGRQSGHEIARGALCAGDAAGYIHPLTGDGMAMALRAGELAGATARLVPRGLEVEEAARLYRAAWEREFGARLQLAARLHPLAIRPKLARPILPILRHLPALSGALVRGTRGSF